MNASRFDPHALHSQRVRHPKTFLDMVTVIQDEVDDTTSEYLAQVSDSILTALRRCEQEPFFFNQKRTATFKTRKGKGWYGREDNPLIEANIGICSVSLEDKDRLNTDLVYQPSDLFQTDLFPRDNGGETRHDRPVFYTLLERRIGVFPIPQRSVTLRFSYVPFPQGEGDRAQEDPIWSPHAFDLIKARAKYELYKNILKDSEAAAVSYNDFQEQLKLLHCETSRRSGMGRILSTGF